MTTNKLLIVAALIMLLILAAALWKDVNASDESDRCASAGGSPMRVDGKIYCLNQSVFLTY